MQVIKEIQNKRSLGATLNAQYKKGMSLSMDAETQTNLKSEVFPLFLCKGAHPTELLLKTSAQLGDNSQAVTKPNETTRHTQTKTAHKRNKFVIVGGSIVAIVAIVLCAVFALF